MGQMRRNFFRLLILTCLSAPTLSQAEDTRPNPCRQADEQVTTISSSAEIPPPLKKPKTIIPLGCDRPFIYRGEIYSADPPQAQDASTLKYFMKDVPEANRILEEYQKKRIQSQISAYTGTAGIFMLIFASTLGSQFDRSNPNGVAGPLRLGGLALASGGFLYSFLLIRSNDSLIPQAVQTYNHSKPDDPIELKFTTGWSF